MTRAHARRRLAIFSETFARLSGLADRLVRREGGEMLRLIDATPIPLGKVVEWAKRNGRIRGLKMHVVYDPVSDNPTFVDITDANVNDIEIGRTVRSPPATPTSTTRAIAPTTGGPASVLPAPASRPARRRARAVAPNACGPVLN